MVSKSLKVDKVSVLFIKVQDYARNVLFCNIILNKRCEK